mmetsp:Transcript_74415/g.155128  ORF Transcript_74415/g.155128 Transcript_74415/m.155128 type:complete len:84 (-) Transcript_74415:1123-1374(-)
MRRQSGRRGKLSVLPRALSHGRVVTLGPETLPRSLDLCRRCLCAQCACKDEDEEEEERRCGGGDSPCGGTGLLAAADDRAALL